MASRTNVAIAVVFLVVGAAVVLLVPRDDGVGHPGQAGARGQSDGGLVITWAPPTAGDAAAPAAGETGPRPEPADGEISVLSLVAEMADLDHLARLASPSFVAKQASSYDRRSKRPDDPETWFANDDFVTNEAPNLVRVETAAAPGAGRYVLLDAQGPGAVVRLWTAAPAGTLRIFIDGDPRPALEAPMGALLGGRVEPFTAPFGQVTAMGHSLYFPFPFRQRCLVTLDSIDSIDPFSGRTIDKLYYQIGYRAYAGARAEQVRPFSAAEVLRARAALERVATALTSGRPFESTPPPGSAGTTVTIERALVDSTHPSVTIVDGLRLLGRGSRDVAARAAPAGGVIRTLRLTTPERDPARLRATTLSITFDGEETVRAPLADFFGSGPGWNPYVSLPMTIGADGTLACRFRMPFRARAIVTIARAAVDEANAGAPPWPPLEISGAVTVDAAPFTDASLLFHAGFLRPERLATRPIRDWHLATLEGHGQQVGTVLGVFNPPGVAWWGEGDEKIFVDGETFPSLFGTGTEDYFGFAWSSIERFAHPYHAQTLAPPGGFAGWFSMNRFLVLDPVPFATRLRFDLELWHWSDTTVEASALLYWYARPGGRDDLPR
jgi:hypothetical protein